MHSVRNKPTFVHVSPSNMWLLWQRSCMFDKVVSALQDLYNGYHPDGPSISLFWFVALYGVFELLLFQVTLLC